MKKLLTLDDLYNFYVNRNQSLKFNAKESGQPLVVQVPANITSFSNDEENMNDSLVPVHLKACHTEKNRNGSYISESKMKANLSSIKNKPILAYIHEVDGVEEFGWHAMHEKDDELIYDEIPVGTIPESCNAKLEYDKDNDKTYVHVDGYLFGQYNHSVDILNRMGGEAKVSVELNVFELSFDAKNKVLNIEDFEFSGVTILGKDENGNEIGEGMEGSNITFADFSAEKNSTINQKLLEEIEKLNATLSSFNIDSSTKEGGKSEMAFEEILAKFGKTFEDIDFDYSEMSAEEFEAKLNELFGEAESPSEDEESESEKIEEELDSEEDDTGEEQSAEEEFSDSSEEENEEEVSEDKNSSEDVRITGYSIDMSNGQHIGFSVSLNEQIEALSTLVNDTYAESDNAWYMVTVYDNYVIMSDYWNGVHYKQTYKKRKDVYSLTGDRVPVYVTFCTQEELDSLETMRSNYSSIETELNKYKEAEDNQKKMNILNSSEYDYIKNTEEYKNLVSTYTEYSVEAVQNKCDSMLLAFVKNGGKVDSVQKTNKGIIPIPEASGKSRRKSRYGNLFK